MQIKAVLTAALLSLTAVASAQEALRVGDAVEAHSYAWGGPTGWGKAKITQIDRVEVTPDLIRSHGTVAVRSSGWDKMRSGPSMA